MGSRILYHWIRIAPTEKSQGGPHKRVTVRPSDGIKKVTESGRRCHAGRSTSTRRLEGDDGGELK